MNKYPLLLAILVIVHSACSTSVPVSEADNHEHIRFNQLGYYPDAVKELLVTDYKASSFRILDAKGRTAFEGELVNKGAGMVPVKMCFREIFLHYAKQEVILFS